MTYECICDPAVLFDPPDPQPVAVDGCPAHTVRRSVQLWIRQTSPGTYGWSCVEHPGPAECATATTCRMRPAGGES